MDCKDLMVGDWVMCNHYQDMPFTKQFGVADFAKGEYEFCEPIPLTEEILVKNGFDKDERSRYYHEYILELELWDFDISWTNAGGFKYEDIRLAYVHQLQHLLRLCGLKKEIEL